MHSSRILKLAALAAMAILAAGCEVEGPAFEQVPMSATHAVVYVYRPYALAGSDIEPDVTCGNQTIAIGAGGYHAFALDPGMITCQTGDSGMGAIHFDARPERDYYVRETMEGGYFSTRANLTLVDRASGRSEIASARQQ